MLYYIILIGFPWVLGGWMAGRQPDLGHLVLTLVVTTILTSALAYIFQGVVADALGSRNSLAVAVRGAIQGAAYGFVVGGISSWRARRKRAAVPVPSRDLQDEEDVGVAVRKREPAAPLAPILPAVADDNFGPDQRVR